MIEGHKCNICNFYWNITNVKEHYEEHLEEDKILLEEYNKLTKNAIVYPSLFYTDFYKNKTGKDLTPFNYFEEQDVENFEKKYCCHLCNSRFETIQLLTEHNKTHQ